MIQSGNPVVASELIAHSKIRVLQSRDGIHSQVFVPVVVETRCGQNGVEHPLRLEFPADTAARNDGILSFHVNADANDELQIGIINIGAADLERHVEIGRPGPESFAINAGGSFHYIINCMEVLSLVCNDSGDGLESAGKVRISPELGG